MPAKQLLRISVFAMWVCLGLSACGGGIGQLPVYPAANDAPPEEDFELMTYVYEAETADNAAENDSES